MSPHLCLAVGWALILTPLQKLKAALVAWASSLVAEASEWQGRIPGQHLGYQEQVRQQIRLKLDLPSEVMLCHLCVTSCHWGHSP